MNQNISGQNSSIPGNPGKTVLKNPGSREMVSGIREFPWKSRDSRPFCHSRFPGNVFFGKYGNPSHHPVYIMKETEFPSWNSTHKFVRGILSYFMMSVIDIEQKKRIRYIWQAVCSKSRHVIFLSIIECKMDFCGKIWSISFYIRWSKEIFFSICIII